MDNQPEMFRLLSDAVRRVRAALSHGFPNLDRPKNKHRAAKIKRDLDAWHKNWKTAIGDSDTPDRGTLLGLLCHDHVTEQPGVFMHDAGHLLPRKPEKQHASEPFPTDLNKWEAFAESEHWKLWTRRAWALPICDWVEQRVKAFWDYALPRIWVMDRDNRVFVKTSGEWKEREPGQGGGRHEKITGQHYAALRRLKSEGAKGADVRAHVKSALCSARFLFELQGLVSPTGKPHHYRLAEQMRGRLFVQDTKPDAET